MQETIMHGHILYRIKFLKVFGLSPFWLKVQMALQQSMQVKNVYLDWEIHVCSEAFDMKRKTEGNITQIRFESIMLSCHTNTCRFCTHTMNVK